MSLSSSLLCYCPFYCLVFTGWYFSSTQAAEAPPRHSWSNMPLTGLHSTLLQQPFLTLNMHHSESRSHFFQWMGYVKIQVKFARRSFRSLLASEGMRLTFLHNRAPQAVFRESFVKSNVCTSLIYKCWNDQKLKASNEESRTSRDCSLVCSV